MGSFHNKTALIKVIACSQTENKPLPATVVVKYIYAYIVSRPQWVNRHIKTFTKCHSSLQSLWLLTLQGRTRESPANTFTCTYLLIHICNIRCLDDEPEHCCWMSQVVCRQEEPGAVSIYRCLLIITRIQKTTSWLSYLTIGNPIPDKMVFILIEFSKDKSHALICIVPFLNIVQPYNQNRHFIACPSLWVVECLL